MLSRLLPRRQSLTWRCSGLASLAAKLDVKRKILATCKPFNLNLLDSVAGRISGKTVCTLGDAAAMPVQSFLKHYRHEFAYMIEQGRCLAA